METALAEHRFVVKDFSPPAYRQAGLPPAGWLEMT